MKLDFESNASRAALIDEGFSDINNPLDDDAEVSALLRAGVEAAQTGDRAVARHLLLRVTEMAPAEEDAWLWLASVSEYPEELLGFLNHVLEINPANAAALERLQATKNLLAKNLIERGADASKNSRRKFARQCFLQAIAHDETNETGWLWLASVSDSEEEKVAHLKKVLNLNPENENALVLLKSVKNHKADYLLQKAIAAAIAGEREAARQMLAETLNAAPQFVDAWILKSFLVESFEEKIECFERILDVDDENELANLNWTALLDIMAKADANTQIPDAKQFSAENNFDEPKALFALPTNENLIDSDVLPEENFEIIESNFQNPVAAEDFFPDGESRAEFQSNDDFNRSEDDNSQLNEDAKAVFANPASAVTANFEDAAPNYSFADDAQNYSNDFQSAAESSQEFAADDSPSDSGEIALPSEILPSYYDGEEDVLEPLEAAEKDYSQEFTENEPDIFDDDFLKSKETAVFDEQEIGEAAELSQVEEIGGKEELDAESFADVNLPKEKSAVEIIACPFCSRENDAQAFVCGDCRAMLTLADLEMLLAHHGADRETLRRAVERLEEEKTWRDFGVEDFKLLAIAEINLKNLRQGCAYLNEAAQINPNDVVLSSQVNSLKIRLSEIEEQQSIHDSMPKNRKILVVDDSLTVRKLITGKLEKSGHEVICAVDGIDALEKIKELVPDLILLDINMPRMDGYQVCKLIRSNESTKDVPVVMISGKDGFFDKVRGRMAGTTGYITKPFGPETLMKTIDTYIVEK